MRNKCASPRIKADLVAALQEMGFVEARRLGGNIVAMQKGHISVKAHHGLSSFVVTSDLCTSFNEGAADIEDIQPIVHKLQSIGSAVDENVRDFAKSIERYFTANHVFHLVNSKSVGVYEFYTKGTSSVLLFVLKGYVNHDGKQHVILSSREHDGEPVQDLEQALTVFRVWNQYNAAPEMNSDKSVVTLAPIENYIHVMLQRGVLDVEMQEYKLELSCANEMASPLVSKMDIKSIREPRRVYEIHYKY